MKVSFEGVGEQVLSFGKATGTEKGALVKLSAAATVSTCASGEKFVGVCIGTDGDFAAVKTAGYVELGYTGTAPALGFAKLAADTDGKVKAADGGREYLVIKVDSTAAIVGFIM